MVADEGYGSHQLAEWLNRQGFKSSTGSRFHSSNVLRILKNEIYHGFMVRGTARSERIEELQIVPDQLFFRVQQILEERTCKEEHKRTVCRSNKSQSLLGGNLFCGHCGCRLVASRRTEKTVHKDGSVKERNYGIYVCYHRSRGLNDCDGATTYIADRVDKCVLQTVHEIFANIAGCPEEEKIQLAFKRSVEASRLEQVKLAEQIAKDEKQLDTLRAEIANALTGNSVYTSEDLSTAIAAARTRIDESRERLKTLQDEEEQKKVMSDGIIPAYRRFRTWALEFDETSLEGKKMIINELFSRIELSKDYTISGNTVAVPMVASCGLVPPAAA